jgi:hypothetical protein
VLVGVEATDLTHTQSITLKTDDGAERRLAVAPEAATAGHPVSPSHLRQHMTYGDRVVVEYVQRPEGDVAVRIDDAP